MWQAIELWQGGLIVLVGLIAGIAGGLLGIGGSLIMIPCLVMLFGHDRIEGVNQHLYQAAAMIANVAVAVPAAWRHYRKGATVPQALAWMLPAALLAVLVGVALSNLPLFAGHLGGRRLGRVLAAFIIYVIFVNVRKLIGRAATQDEPEPHVTPGPAVAVGGIMGIIAGLLGVGGGVMAVPLQQVLMRMPLRAAIANSSAVICVSASLGAIYKNVSLGLHHARWQDSLLLAGILAPTCWIGGLIGASLTHRLPVRQVRIALIVFLAVAALRMLDIQWW